MRQVPNRHGGCGSGLQPPYILRQGIHQAKTEKGPVTCPESPCCILALIEPQLQPHPVLKHPAPASALLGPSSPSSLLGPLYSAAGRSLALAAWLEAVWMKAESPSHMPQLHGINPASGERWSLAWSLQTDFRFLSAGLDSDGDWRHLPKGTHGLWKPS